MGLLEAVVLLTLSLGGGAGGVDGEDLAAAQDAHELRVGHWVEVKGRLDESGRFLADEIEVLPPEDKERLTGTVERVDSRERFTLLGRRVRVSERTEWKDIALEDLQGERVRVEGRYRGPGIFSSREIVRRGKGRDSIEGRIDAIELEGAFLRLSIVGFDVLLERDSEVEHELPLERIELAPERAVRPRELAGDEDDELPGTIRLTDDLTLGGQAELEALHKDNVDLDDDKPQDREDYTVSERLRLLWAPTPDFLAVLGARFEHRWRVDEDDGWSDRGDSRINEAYLYWRDALDWGWDLQLGRQDFDDEREWIYDQNLDALRLIRSTPGYRLELSASTTLSDGSDLDESTVNLIGYLSNNSYRRHAALWVVDRHDEDDFGTRSTHVGGRLLGEWLPSTESWLEVAAASGELGGEDLDGIGLDVGATWLPDADWAPYVVGGWALGGEDFRQTGLQDDNDKFGGVTSYRYYGELVDPELANLSVLTLGLGKRVTRGTSLDLVWHKLDQVEAAPQLARSDLRAKPDGVHTDLGWELDLVLGSRDLRSTHVEAVLGYFEPGAAFPDGDAAWLARLQLRFRF